MPRLRPKQKPPAERFEFTEAICVEGFSVGWSDPIRRGVVYPADHPMVRAAPEFWRWLGPSITDEEVE